MYLPPQVSRVLDTLENAGFEAYIVGGCVRDALLGAKPADYDVTTSAMPEEIKRVFAGERVIETGLKHGTVTVLIGDMPIEITTFRIDADYADNRHPGTVKFTKSLREDAARRDFTMNSLAYNERVGFADHFGGRADIERGLIRCVGDADLRFREDALRIMRAVRFSAVLGFEIEPATRRAVFDNRALLQHVSAERIAAELIKLLCGKAVRHVIVEYAEVLGAILPELLSMKGFAQRNPHHIYDVLEHSAAAAENVPPDPILRLAALLHDVGKPDCFSIDASGVGHFYNHAAVSEEKADTILRRLKLDKLTRRQVTTLVKWHSVPLEADTKLLKRRLNQLTPEVFFKLIKLQRADNLAVNPAYWKPEEEYDKLERMAREIVAQQACFSIRDLAVNGADLIACGIAPGKQIGAILQWMLEAVISEKVPNEKKALLEYWRNSGI